MHSFAAQPLFEFLRFDSVPEIQFDRRARPQSAEARMAAAPDFKQLIDAHYQGLYRFAQSLCRREGLAEDLVQQTFLQWARKGHTLRDVSKAKTWLFTTLYREWLAIARQEQKHEHVEFEPELHGTQDELPDEEPPPVDSATLHRALGALDEHYRVPLVLFYLRELSYRDIAETLGLPIGTVMSRLSRAKDTLRRILQQTKDVTE
ncbi:RNA polymerase sigma-70 factor, ECF subfamily [Prosthecobacter debontii]|uniref:RNA polymerase sigma-70 factor, ECF subfamily n=1 Tax=Prosthecobacter debontii TaxID=48467 RepID=A0A1T4Z0N6_9BACT|nr:RNA polymerase sigma factor [Prosthecobacter debontii]SKB07368.1 RNA polymerase sigma-70 factor, ECF subfamily [Prosthecobacter debontii]